MKLINDVLKSPFKSTVGFGGLAAVSHFILALDMLVTGGVCAVGAYFVWKANNDNG